MVTEAKEISCAHIDSTYMLNKGEYLEFCIYMSSVFLPYAIKSKVAKAGGATVAGKVSTTAAV